jgi:hypothetical protein
MFKIGSQVEIVRNINSYKGTEKAFYNAGDNTGNLLFTYGILSFLDPDKVLVEEIPGKPPDYFNLIIFAFSNLIRHKSNLRLDTLYQDLLEIVRTYKCPFLVFGLGSQSTIADVINHFATLSPVLLELLRELSTRCQIIFARDENTRHILTFLEIHNVVVCGCPSILLNRNHQLGELIAQRIRAPPSTSICIAYQSFDWVNTYLREWPRIVQEPSDLLVVSPDIETHLFFNLHSWCTYLQTKDICIGPRIHGTIAGLMVERLGINICHDVRTRGLCTTMHLPYIDIVDIGFDIQQMIQKIRFDPILFTSRRQEFARSYMEALQFLHVPISDQLPSIINGTCHTTHIEIIDRHVMQLSPLPPDFDTDQYRLLNPDLRGLTDIQAELHYERSGYLEKRSFCTPICLPVKFEPIEYRRWNPDLAMLDDAESIAHYLKHGYREKRLYTVDVPSYFDIRWYRHWNPDIATESDIWLQKHYVLYGQTEGRLCQYTLPRDFDSYVYRWYNSDLTSLSELFLQRHYQLFGHQEHRLYRDPWFDPYYFIRTNRIESYRGHIDYSSDIRQAKSQCATDIYASIQACPDAILLVSHDSSLYGATHYIYMLFNMLRTLKKKVIMLDAYPNIEIQCKYNVESYYYYQDPTILYWICRKVQPRLIYFNSINTTMERTIPWLGIFKLCLHSHEIRAHYPLCPDLVVSDRIASQYTHAPSVQPPILDTHFILVNSTTEIGQLLNNGRVIGADGRIIIGMSGSLSMRKNYILFLEVAGYCAEYDFVWIGGSTTLVTILPNVFHVLEVGMPYAYYTKLDYFVLFSLEDPCPYVILENLLLGNRVLTFRDNIYTRHHVPGQYFEFQGSISVTTAIDHIRLVCTSKRPDILPTAGRYYVENNYTLLSSVTMSILGI